MPLSNIKIACAGYMQGRRGLRNVSYKNMPKCIICVGGGSPAEAMTEGAMKSSAEDECISFVFRWCKGASVTGASWSCT